MNRFLGAAELLVFLGLSLFLLFGIRDLSRALDDYLALRKVAEAAASYAVRAPGLELGSFAADGAKSTDQHASLQRRLLKTLTRFGFKSESIRVRTELREDFLLGIHIECVYTPKLGLLHAFPISVTATRVYKRAVDVKLRTNRLNRKARTRFRGSNRDRRIFAEVLPKNSFRRAGSCSKNTPIAIWLPRPRDIALTM